MRPQPGRTERRRLLGFGLAGFALQHPEDRLHLGVADGRVATRALRGALRAAREEARESREAREEADRWAQRLSVKVKELEARAEMAETNLRTLLASARGTGRDATLGDTEMEAILGVLKGEGDGDGDGETA